MDLKCLKCNNKFTEIDISDVYATSCGHLFHCQCLIHWLERSQTCPYCTESQSFQDVLKIYFGLADISQKNSQELKTKLHSVSDELQEKSDDLKSLKAETAKLKIRKKELREELSKLKKQLEVKRGAIQFKRMAIDYHARICKVKEKYETEAVGLRQRLNTLQSMNEIINGPESKIDDIVVRSTLDQAGLTLCLDTLAESLENSDQFNEKLDEDLVSYQNDLIRMEEELNSLKAEYSTLLKELQEGEEEDFSELSELRRNIYRLMQNCCSEYLFIIFPELENFIDTPSIEETIPEMSKKPSSSEASASLESTSQRMDEAKFSQSLPDFTLQKKCKDLVKNACKNPLQYLTSGRVELFDSDDDDDAETLITATNEEQKSRFYGSSKLKNRFDNNKYKKLVKKKHLSAEAGPAAKKPTSSDSGTNMSYYSVLDLMASAQKKK